MTLSSPLGAVLHGPKDLRLEPVLIEPLGPRDVRVSLGAAGICGSDQHYYHNARMGDFVLQSPFALGHEMSGDITACGEEVEGFAPGDRVVIDPALTCGHCPGCRSGRSNLCHNVKFMGSASHVPHLDGGYRESFVVSEQRCVKVPRNTPHNILCVTEPLSVAVHAVERAGPMLGRKVVIAGAGTIGTLLASVVKAAGAARVCVSDPSVFRRNRALEMGATDVMDPQVGEIVPEIDARGGAFDVAFEASGHPSAFKDIVCMTRRGGRAVLVGMIPSQSCEVPFNQLTAREIDLVSTFRQNNVFERSAQMLIDGVINPSPIITAQFSLNSVLDAFRASFRVEEHIKVLLTNAQD